MAFMAFMAFMEFMEFMAFMAFMVSFHSFALPVCFTAVVCARVTLSAGGVG
eukprot:SAG31_NODE_47_length_30979_cov_41.708841_3_plen_51_part_00